MALALKVVGESIRELFGGQLEAFLDEAGSGTLFGGIRRLLSEQIERSSALEQSVLRVLAVEREPVSISHLIGEVGRELGVGPSWRQPKPCSAVRCWSGPRRPTREVAPRSRCNRLYSSM
jgi:hypothetical protein